MTQITIGTPIRRIRTSTKHIGKFGKVLKIMSDNKRLKVLWVGNKNPSYILLDQVTTAGFADYIENPRVYNMTYLNLSNLEELIRTKLITKNSEK